MNWTFRSIPMPAENLPGLIKQYSELAAEGIEKWLENFEPEADVQPEGFVAEYPDGFLREPGSVAYRFTFSAGWYNKKYGYMRIGPIPYDITIERADSGLYASEVDAVFPLTHLRSFESGLDQEK